MQATIVASLMLCPLLACAAGFEGRWQGHANTPGRELRIVLDLAPEPSGGWSGSIILTGLGIKGAPLSDIVVGDAELAFDLGTLLSVENDGPARFRMHLDGDTMAGEMRQAGNVAQVALAREGSAQVDTVTKSTPVARVLEDEWRGEFELGGYPREVTITLVNHPGSAATATLLVVGKKVNDLPVDLVVEEGSVLRIESRTTRVAFEGRLIDNGEALSGTIEVASMERPLILRRATRRPS